MTLDTNNRRICVVTGSRADYGLLRPLLTEIEKRRSLQLQLVVTGAHLSAKFGNTVDVIQADGFSIAERVDMLDPGDDARATSRSVAAGINGFASALETLRPDVMVVLGDRFEIFAAASAAMIARVPIAHIHGGEVTQGAIDDAMRHAITKMAHLHFVSADEYRRRVIQMGEDASRVFDVGAIGLDNLQTMEFLDKSALETALGANLASPLFLATYHPATLQADYGEQGALALTQALAGVSKGSVVFTGVNADPGNAGVAKVVADFAKQNPSRVFYYDNLGQQRYLSMMKLADVVIGNSSSGIIEAPAFGTPTVNIGNRQAGRIRARSIIDCDETVEHIAAAIQTALSDDFRANLTGMHTPYGDGTASIRIADALETVDLTNILIKPFVDR